MCNSSVPSGFDADPGSWKRYAYTRNDPVNRMDPFGLDDCTPSPGIDFCVTGTARSEGKGPGGGELNQLDLALFLMGGGSGSGPAGGPDTMGGESVQMAM